MTLDENSNKISRKDIQKLRGKLLDWFDTNGRKIPWRIKSHEEANPYHVWLSEVMCQQTTVKAASQYYHKFLDKWPCIHSLASAHVNEVMEAWAGLGYYSRARNLHKCAQIVSKDLGGQFPLSEIELKRLPGIGEYTAAAIVSIAYQTPATVVDGNIERVISRLFLVKEPLPRAKSKIKQNAQCFYEGYLKRPGDLVQSLMDLGAMICLPQAPKCNQCPMRGKCLALKYNVTKELPKKRKSKRTKKYGNVYWVERKNGCILFHRREERGLLGGMLGLPTSHWECEQAKHPQYIENPVALNAMVEHTFSHFDLKLNLFKAEISEEHVSSDFVWLNIDNTKHKLPSVFQKALQNAMEELKPKVDTQGS